ncbi:MAG: ABC transporter substrate-binding protein [Spirochaetales bacterium]|nr:ABC transporter substrate-binding protein [Spirochaetales bacterium]
MNRFKYITAFFIIVTVGFQLHGMAGKAEGENSAFQEITLTDTLGRTTSFDGTPERILLAGKAVVFVTNTLYLFPEAESAVVGTGSTDQGLGDFFSIVDTKFESKMRFSNSAGPEQLIAAKPDVVILKSYLKRSLGDPLEILGIPVLYVDLEAPDSFYSDVAMIGALLGNPERAGNIIDYYKSKTTLVENRTDSKNKPTVLVLSYSARDGDTAFSVPPAHWLQTDVVEKAGGIPVWKDENRGDGWKKVNLEQVAVWDPDYIFVISYRSPALAVIEDLNDRIGLGILRAATEKHILPFPADYYSWDQPDPRWILGLLWMARTLHPESFPEMDIAEEVKYFYSELYGLEDSVIEKEILSRLQGVLSSTP